MRNDRLSILLPVDTYLLTGDKRVGLSHMQIKKNDVSKRYELRFFNQAQLEAMKQYHNMTINVINGDSGQLSIHISESSKANTIELVFAQEKDVLRIKKYVDTLLI